MYLGGDVSIKLFTLRGQVITYKLSLNSGSAQAQHVSERIRICIPAGDRHAVIDKFR